MNPQDEADGGALVSLIRAEIRFELGLLHDRVNALVAAEAFLTIAFTTAMGNVTPWGATFAKLASPLLAVLGLALALLALPGINGTVAIIATWTSKQLEVLNPSSISMTSKGGGLIGDDWPKTSQTAQQRGLLFFRAVPILFAATWVGLLAMSASAYR